ncbi:hypothetical protein [Micromonospora haikouensis]|uniref:hypothetical protein n=1 Tax=Micromonospora haikouensis TaxID=686309 RepID=UPI003D74DB1F
MLVVGDQGDGTYSVTGLNGGVVVATDLDLPAGTITETDISDDAISTPKLVANAITADKIAAGAITANKIAADAIDGKTITGVTITGATITGSQVIAGPDGEITIDETGVTATNPEDNLQYARLSVGDEGEGSTACLTLNFGRPYGWEDDNTLSPSSGTITAEQIGNFEDDPTGRYAPTLRLMSPHVPGYPDPPSGPVVSVILMRAVDEEGRASEIMLSAGRVLVPGDLLVAGRDQGRGKVAETVARNSATGIGTTATAAETINSVTFRSGRAYKIEVGGGVYSSTDGTLARRSIAVGGTVIANLLGVRCVSGSNVIDAYSALYLRRTATTDRTTSIAHMVSASAGTVARYGAADAPRWIAVHDVGAAADFPEATTIPG